MAAPTNAVAAQASKLRESLDLPALLAALAISQEEVDLLNALAAGHRVEGGQLALQALKVKLTYTCPTPAQRIAVAVMPAFFCADPYAALGDPAAKPIFVDTSRLPLNAKGKA